MNSRLQGCGIRKKCNQFRIRIFENWIRILFKTSQDKTFNSLIRTSKVFKKIVVFKIFTSCFVYVYSDEVQYSWARDQCTPCTWHIWACSLWWSSPLTLPGLVYSPCLPMLSAPFSSSSASEFLIGNKKVSTIHIGSCTKITWLTTFFLFNQ